jgi:5-methylcytosine-specific restriction endonuclease McrA
MVKPTCHPDRKHQAKGLCDACYSRLKRSRNPELYNSSSRLYTDRHPERRRSAKLKWQAKFPERHKAQVRFDVKARKARLRGATVNNLTKGEWELLKIIHLNSCAYCGDIPDKLTQDHVIPLSKGGAHSFENIVPACVSCNSSKGTQLADDFINNRVGC